MILLIDTSDPSSVLVGLYNNGELIASRDNGKARHKQSQLLIKMIDALLLSKKIKPKNLSAIAVNNETAPFSALRIGIATANAMGWSLGVPVFSISRGNRTLKQLSIEIFKEAKKIPRNNLVKPQYGSAPNITFKKK